MVKKLLSLTLFFIFVQIAVGQTTHISPTGDGGFENGATFAVNGWTSNTPSQQGRNQWIIGTEAASGFTGTNAAYVTNARNTNPPPHTYTISTNSRVSHMYRDINVPSAEADIQLNLDWICYGESSYDKMNIWLVPTSFIPNYGTGIDATGTAPTGRVQVGGNFSAQTNWTNSSFSIPAAYAGTPFRIVFEWSNDNNGGTDPPIAIDNISLVSNALTSHCTPEIPTLSSTYINNFSTSGGVANISNLNSGWSTNGYQNNYPTNTVSQFSSGTVGFSLNMQGGTAGIAIWVDWNNNFIFESSELVYSPNIYANTGTYTGNITVPVGTSIGNYRMRVKTDWNAQVPDPCTNGGNATETEDYKFTVIAAPACAAQPTGLTSSIITSTSATINWTAATPPPALGYQYYYSTSPTTPTTGTTPSGSDTTAPWSANLTGLASNTTYYFWVRSNCNATDKSAWAGYSTFKTLAVAPNNDLCANATSLPCGTSNLTGTTNLTSNTPVTIGCSMSNYGVWYTFVGDGDYTTITVDAAFDAEIGLASGSCGALTNLACQDGGNPETYSFVTTNGVTYYVYVAYWTSGSTTGNFTISRSCTTVTVPPNDLCANATSLPCGTSNLTGTTNLTSNTPVTIGCSMSNYGVWYTFVGVGDYTTITVDAAFDVEIGLASGSCGALINLACNDTGNPETYGFVTTNGVTYYLYIASWSSGSSTTGNFTITRSCETVIVPPNDLCNDATDLPCGTINLAGTTNFTSNIATISGCSMSNNGVWYTFVGDGQASTISSTGAAGFDHEMSISTGNCVNQESMACIDNAGSGGTETYTFNTTLGVQYYVYIAYNSTFGNTTGSFTISRSCSPPAYCIPSSTNTSEYINNFTATGDGVSNINNLSTGSSITSSGYSNYSQVPGGPLTVTQIENGAINFTVNMIPTVYTYGFNIWVDWDDDFNFTAAELVYASGAYITSATGSFTIPGGTSGTHIMRIRSSEFNISPPACGNISYGEAEDYLLTVTPLNCTANPSNLIATATSTTSANISWTAATPAPGLGYDYLVSTNPSGTPTIASGTITGTTVNVTGLNSGTTYYVFVRGRCNNTDQGYWLTTTLTTGCTNVVTTPTVCPLIIDEQGNNPFTANPFISDPTVDIDCNVPNVTLVANSNLRATTSYIVEQITYPTSPEPEFNFPILGTGAQAINSDDVWASSRTDLGFNFCFYNETFNQTLVGANGMITFDTANTPGSYCGWQFSNNLPSVANDLFEKTIYGVYHDIDPRNITTRVAIKSRTVGAAPCRQFQVSWNDIPMFGDATRLYTGMIVLHETTNIIEVFIKEKRIENGNVSPWNGGNAIVGIQGDISPLSPNNQWVAAPCRNGLDTNWEATNEAWRFTPNGAVIAPTSITWYEGSAIPGNEVTSNGDGSLTVSDGGTYFASVNYSTCSGTVNLVDEIVVTSNRKVWNGSESNNWYRANNWTPTGIPTSSDCVVIPATTATNGRSPVVDIINAPPLPPNPAVAKSVSVRDNGSLEVNANTFLEIVDELNVQTSGEVLIKSTGSLIQVTDVTANNNTGNIRMQREVLGVGAQNYVYWSSPVEDFNVGSISAAPSEQKYQWNPTQAGLNGTWEAASGNMIVGKGYIVRGLISPTTSPANNAEFMGRPSNGIINTSITRGTWTGGDYTAVGGGTTLATNIDDNWNLVGNPYPSAISASAFIAENTAGTPKIDGTIYLWNHAGLPTGTTNQDPFYGNYVYNYLGSSYVATNGVGSTPNVFFGSIAAGQSFFVQMLDGVGVSNTVNFNNTMRSGSPANNNFLRTGERHRIWLDLINSNEDAISTLIGYVTDATNDRDLLFDGYDLNDTSIQLYSLIGEEEMTIQGRALPLDQEDRVPLGIVVPQNTTYKIAINSVDGVFGDASQNIYLEDTYLNIIYDLKISPYTFTSESGTFNDRFILRYTNETLSTPDEQVLGGVLISAPNNTYIKVSSGFETIKSVAVYDVLGRNLFNNKNINEKILVLNNFSFSNGTYIVKVTLNNGLQKTQKVVLNQ